MDIPVKDRNTKEVEAESVAFTVCQHFGIDTSDYSFGYYRRLEQRQEYERAEIFLDTNPKDSFRTDYRH